MDSKIINVIDWQFDKWYKAIPKNIVHSNGLGVGFLVPRKEGFEAGFIAALKWANVYDRQRQIEI